MALGVVGEPDGTWVNPRVAPDGRRVIAARTIQGNPDLWLFASARASRFTTDPTQDQFPVWSPDGTRIVYSSSRAGIGALFQKLTDGAGAEAPLLSTDQFLIPTSWSPDGMFVLYHSLDPTTNADIWVMPTSQAAGQEPFVFLKTTFREAYGQFSPDGKWVAYHSNETGRPEVYVRPFTRAGANGAASGVAAGSIAISTAGGIHPTCTTSIPMAR
jgi:Tol biopolymer transport system component